MLRYGSVLAGLLLTGLVLADDKPVAVAVKVDGPRPIMVLDIVSLNSVVKDLDMVAGKLYLPPVGSNFNMMVAGALGVGGLDGVDVSAPVTGLFFMGPEFAEPVAAIDEDGEPVAEPDPGAVVWSFKPDGAPDKFKAALSLVYPQVTNHADGIIGYDDPDGVPLPRQLYVKEQDGRIYASQNRLALESALAHKAVAGSLISPTLAGSLRVGFNLSALVPVLDEKLQETTRLMAAMSAQNATDGPDPAGIVKAEADALLGAMRQMKSLSLSVNATPKALDISYAFTPVEGSVLEKMVKGAKPASPLYAGLMPTNALFGMCAGGADQMDLLMEPYCELMDKMSISAGGSASNMPGLLRKQIAAFKGMNMGDIAIIVAPRTNGRLGFAEAIAVKDPVKAKALMEDQMKNYNTLFGAVSPGITLDARPGRKIAGVESLAFTYRIDFDAMPSSGPRPDMPMLEDGISGEIVFIGNHMVFGMGEGAVDAVAAQLEKSGAGILQNKLVMDLAPELKSQPASLMFVRPLGLLKGIFRMVAPDGGADMLDTLADSGSGAVSFSQVKGPELSGSFRVGIQEINSLKFALPMLGGMMMQSAMSNPSMVNDQSERDALTTCIGNLRQIDSAKEQVAMVKRLKDGDAVLETDVVEYIKGRKMPVCPDGGEYTLNAIGENPECTVLDHELP